MLFLAVAALAPLHFHVDLSEFANAVYHVACLTDRIACSKPIVAKFWNEEYHVTKEDATHFDDFRTAMESLENAAGAIPPSPFMPNFAGYYPPFRLRVRIVAAALGAKSAADFRRRAAPLAKRETVDHLAGIFDAVEKRLHPWWVATGAPTVRPKLKGLERQINQLGAPALARDVAAFLEVGDAGRDVYLHAIASPGFAGSDATATPTLNHFCMEIIHEFDAAGVTAIAVHELTHSLYELAPAEKKVALMQAFVGSPDPAAQGLYMYLNEAVATAVQLLFLERNGQHDDDPYHNRYIPRLGNAALPLVRDALRQHTTLFGGFAGQYLAAGRKALGEDTDSLAFRFSSPALLGTDELRWAFREAVKPSFVATSEEDRAKFGRLHVVRVMTYDEGGASDRTHRGIATLRSLDSNRFELLLVGRDAAAVGDLSRKVVEWKGPVAAGTLFTVD
jgi:hypothetical protein